MSKKARALLIALIGPAVQALGALWVLANVAIDTGRELTIRYVIFDPGHLTIAVGIALSVVCIPLALKVAAADPEEIELEIFESEPAHQPAAAPADLPGGQWEAAE